MFEYEKKHLAELRSHLAECTVLLQSNGAFPLSAPCRIAAYGSGVRNTVKGGTGSGEVNSRFFVNVEDGLSKSGFSVTTRTWLDAYDQKRAEAKKAFVRQLKAEAKVAKTMLTVYGMGKVMPEPEYELPLDAPGDAAVYVLARISGEGSDRMPVPGDVKLTETEKRDILALNRRFEKFMLVLNVGGPVDLSEVREVGNILVLSQLGVETGAVLADILLGKENPSGRLTTTWSAWEEYAQIGTFGDHNDTRYREGVYVGYRCFDSVGKRPLYPFGFGLSYTSFSLNAESAAIDGSSITAQVRITNTGALLGKEVVQLYLCPPQGRLDKPVQSLAAFTKTKTLAPGESETLTITFDLRDQTSYDEAEGAYILEKGDYLLRFGNSSADTVPMAVIRMEAETVVRKVRNALGKPDYNDWKPDAVLISELPDGLPILSVSDGAIPTETSVYDREETIDQAVKTLSDEKLCYLNVGAFNPKGGMASIIGSASTHVAGAAGETASVLKEKGFAPLIMADGPAGLRLSPRFYRDEKGVHAVGGSGMPESIAELMPAPIRWLSGLLGGKSAPKGAKIEEQYCTAIPVGTAIAQSWNLDFARSCGDIVGDEMERFGVHLWLAPALNIHRSILCGRNYEYFSEDPLISGKMAAAMTNGVQAHPGCGTTVKHYAANNQEYNRYGNNSLVSERAMREIYLRGFEICVRESQPCALMTSYNLLNGEHAAQRRDLIHDILRCEFGFQGIVMTDWWASGAMISKQDIHPAVQPHAVAAAGGDLFMPGSKKDYEAILKALRSGTLSRRQLEINATRILCMTKKLYQMGER